MRSMKAVLLFSLFVTFPAFSLNCEKEKASFKIAMDKLDKAHNEYKEAKAEKDKTFEDIYESKNNWIRKHYPKVLHKLKKTRDAYEKAIDKEIKIRREFEKQSVYYF